MKITISQLFNLELEIAGGKVQDTQITGIIHEDIPFKAKYNLNKILKKVLEEKNLYIEAEKDLFKSLGAVEEDGNLVIKEMLGDGSANPSIEKLTNERLELFKQEIDLGNFKFDIDDFNFKSKSTYPIFMLTAFDSED